MLKLNLYSFLDVWVDKKKQKTLVLKQIEV